MRRRVSEHINKGGMRGQIEVERQRVMLLTAPGTSFMEDNFSTDWGKEDGFGVFQGHYIY